MKHLLKVFIATTYSALLLSSASLAVEVPGKIFYKKPSGELIAREVKLDVPPRGQGKVLLKTTNHTLESHAFKSKLVHGRTVFSVLFLDPPGAPANTAMVLTGTYLRGTNYVAYYGDIYSKIYSGDRQSDFGEKLMDEALAAQDESAPSLPDGDWNFAGGFKFSMPLSNPRN
jgi:hypothetical protein